MTVARKFNFDVEFCSDRELHSHTARDRQKKNLTQEELDLLCANARAEGTQTGEVQALEAMATEARNAAQAVREALMKMSQEFDSIRAEAAQIALAMARKLARAALAPAPDAEVAAALREAMHQAIGEPRILLRASPSVAKALSGQLGEIAHEEGYEGRVQISEDPSLQSADCRIEWRGGGAERSEAAIETIIAALIARRFTQTDIAKEQPDAGE